MPVPNSNRSAELYGKSSKLWCDFANTPNHYINSTNYLPPGVLNGGLMDVELSTSSVNLRRNSTEDPVETYWAIFFEISFFYVPNTLVLIAYVL